MAGYAATAKPSFDTKETMNRPINLLLITAFTLWALPVASAPQYINAEPLSKILADTAVGTIKKGERIQLLVNARCGDIVTVLANGAQSHTQPASSFNTAKLDFELLLENNFPTQLTSYLSGKSPYLRGTLGMINMAAGALSQDPRTKPVIIYQMSWSTGADALVVKAGINSIKSLKGKTIALQAYGPHVGFMSKILQDAGLTVDDVSLRWLPDLTGTANSPVAAFQEDDVDAAFVIMRDALALTSAAAVNTDDSVGGAQLLLSTRTANHMIADVYAVRSDYLQSHRKEVRRFVQALMKAAEELQTLVTDKQSQDNDYKQLLSAAALLLLDNETATAEIEGIYADCQLAGWQDNVNFFTSPSFPRSLAHVSNEMQAALISMESVESHIPLQNADWDYSQLHDGLSLIGSTSAPRFNQQQVAHSIAQQQRKGTFDEGELFSFEILFEPNQQGFPENLYQDAFKKVVEYASTYGGSLITIEGHSDPLGYLRKKSSGETPLLLGRIKQAAKNHSLSHAVAVRNGVISYALSHGVTLNQSQFAVVGRGIANPKSGICDSDPCLPVTEQEWRDNMRIEFRILQLETQASLSSPL